MLFQTFQTVNPGLKGFWAYLSFCADCSVSPHWNGAWFPMIFRRTIDEHPTG
jgi:hypothetical protein